MDAEANNDIEARTTGAFEQIAVKQTPDVIARTALSRFEDTYPSDNSFCSQAKKKYLRRELVETFITLEKEGHDTYRYALEAMEIIRRCDKEIKKKESWF